MTTGAVVVCGSANVDLTVRTARAPGVGETVIGTNFATTGGGKGANQAVAAARMGARTRFVGRVGDDAFGRQLVAGLGAEGIDTSGLTVVAGVPTGVAIIVVDDTADNRIVVVPGANAAFHGDDMSVLAPALEGAAALLLQLEIPMATAVAAARLGRRRGLTVIVDPAPAPADGLPDELVQAATILTPNEHEAAVLVGHALDDDATITAAARALRDRGAGTVVVTLGARGVHWCGSEGTGWRRPPDVQAVDTVGAGDAFNGALAAAFAEGCAFDAAVDRALAAGALAVTRRGAQEAMPRREEVRALLGT